MQLSLSAQHAAIVRAIELETASAVNFDRAETIAASGTADAASRSDAYYDHAVDQAIRAGSYRAAIARGIEHGRAWSRAAA